MALSPLNQRRWRNFRANRRAFWSLWIFLVLYGVSMFAEFLANDVPIAVSYRGDVQFPIFQFYPETAYGGEFRTQADYRTDEVQCLIRTGGIEWCLDDPEDALAQAEASGSVEGEPVVEGWLLWPPIPYSYDTINNLGGPAPSAPDADHWLGTDGGARDVLARVIYGFRLSVSFAFVVVAISSVVGIFAGAVQGFFGGLTDLIAQRLIELWGSVPSLYVIIIIAAITPMNFWLLVFLMVMFSWTALVGVVRAEFLRARNFEYVRAARALGVSNGRIMFRHVLPNAMVATVTMLALWFFVQKTRAGTAMRAISHDMKVARLMGIDVNRTISLTFALGSMLAAIGGLLVAERLRIFQIGRGGVIADNMFHIRAIGDQ